MGQLVPVTGSAFAEAWDGVAAQVSARCRQLSRDTHEAQELYQLTAIRAWRGHSTFRGNSSYLTWVMRILEREAARLTAGRERRARREITLEPKIMNTNTDDQFRADSYTTTGLFPADNGGTGGNVGTEWLAPLLANAVSAGTISETECRVIAERLARPDESWPDIAARLVMTATACAVAHSRAVPKLRVYLFTERGSLLGGAQAIAEAFDRARRDPDGGLTALEAEAFEQLVIRHSGGYRRRGSQAALRGACAKVARRMGLP